jgi:UDP-3-O-[3-hydroxymyristoyl] glucosamine N-acyltransferase
MANYKDRDYGSIASTIGNIRNMTTSILTSNNVNIGQIDEKKVSLYSIDDPANVGNKILKQQLLNVDGTPDNSFPPVSLATIGGPTGSVQYNDSGVQSGSTKFRYDSGNANILLSNTIFVPTINTRSIGTFAIGSGNVVVYHENVPRMNFNGTNTYVNSNMEIFGDTDITGELTVEGTRIYPGGSSNGNFVINLNDPGPGITTDSITGILNSSGIEIHRGTANTFKIVAVDGARGDGQTGLMIGTGETGNPMQLVATYGKDIKDNELLFFSTVDDNYAIDSHPTVNFIANTDTLQLNKIILEDIVTNNYILTDNITGTSGTLVDISGVLLQGSNITAVKGIFTNNVEILKELMVSDNVHASRHLTVTGNAIFNSNVNITKELLVTDNAIFQANVNITKGLIVTDNAIFQQNVNIVKTLLVGNNVEINSGYLLKTSNVHTDRIQIKTGGVLTGRVLQCLDNSGTAGWVDISGVSGGGDGNYGGVLLESGNVYTSVGKFIHTNNIVEYTTNLGVTIDGVVLKDSNVLAFDGIFTNNVSVSSTVLTNNVDERTSGSGVTIDGVVLKDSNVLAFDGIFTNNVAVSSTVLTNNVDERTSGSGVTIDGVVLKDSNVLAFDGIFNNNVVVSSNILTNNIEERTSGSGVIIDGVVLKDSNVLAFDGIFNNNVAVSSTVLTNNVDERTSGSGVTIDGVVLKDSNVLAFDGIFNNNVSVSSTVLTNNVDERTSGSGVTIDGVVLKDSNVLAFDGIFTNNVAVSSMILTNNIIARTGTSVTVQQVVVNTNTVTAKTLNFGLNSIGTNEPAGDLLIKRNGNDLITMNTENVLRVSENTVFSKDIVVTGNLNVLGTQVILNVANVIVEDNMLLLNNGDPGPGVTSGNAGIEIERGSLTNYRFVFDEGTDTFIIGEVGSEQPVATREPSPDVGGIPYWKSASSTFITDSGNMSYNESLNKVILNANVELGKTILVTGNAIFNSNVVVSSNVFTNNIEERTPGQGVRIDGVLLKDSDITVNTLNYTTLNPAINVNISTFTNNSGGTIVKGTAVQLNTLGEIEPLALGGQAIGHPITDITNTGSGAVKLIGNIVTGLLGLTTGDILDINESTGLLVAAGSGTRTWGVVMSPTSALMIADDRTRFYVELKDTISAANTPVTLVYDAPKVKMQKASQPILPASSIPHQVVGPPHATKDDTMMGFYDTNIIMYFSLDNTAGTITIDKGTVNNNTGTITMESTPTQIGGTDYLGDSPYGERLTAIQYDSDTLIFIALNITSQQIHVFLIGTDKSIKNPGGLPFTIAAPETQGVYQEGASIVRSEFNTNRYLLMLNHYPGTHRRSFHYIEITGSGTGITMIATNFLSISFGAWGAPNNVIEIVEGDWLLFLNNTGSIADVRMLNITGAVITFYTPATTTTYDPPHTYGIRNKGFWRLTSTSFVAFEATPPSTNTISAAVYTGITGGPYPTPYDFNDTIVTRTVITGSAQTSNVIVSDRNPINPDIFYVHGYNSTHKHFEITVQPNGTITMPLLFTSSPVPASPDAGGIPNSDNNALLFYLNSSVSISQWNEYAAVYFNETNAPANFNIYHGLCASPGTAGDIVEFTPINGKKLTGFSGLTLGANYYLQSDGTYNTTVSPNHVGIALSATDMFVFDRKLDGSTYGTVTGYSTDVVIQRAGVNKLTLANTLATISTDLTVSGNAVVQNNVHVLKDLIVTGNAIFNSNVNIARELFVTNNAIFQNNVHVLKDITISGNAVIQNNVNVLVDLAVTGNAIFNSNVNIARELFVTNNAIFQNNVNVSKQLFVSDNAIIQNNVHVLKDLVVGSNLRSVYGIFSSNVETYNLSTSTFKMTTGATATHVLTCADTTGVGTWQPATGGGGTSNVVSVQNKSGGLVPERTAVYFFNNSGTVAFKPMVTGEVIAGYTTAPSTDPASVDVSLNGILTADLTGIEIGVKYYTNKANGVVSTNSDGEFIGIGYSTTELLVLQDVGPRAVSIPAGVTPFKFFSNSVSETLPKGTPLQLVRNDTTLELAVSKLGVVPSVPTAIGIPSLTLLNSPQPTLNGDTCSAFFNSTKICTFYPNGASIKMALGTITNSTTIAYSLEHNVDLTTQFTSVSFRGVSCCNMGIDNSGNDRILVAYVSPGTRQIRARIVYLNSGALTLRTESGLSSTIASTGSILSIFVTKVTNNVAVIGITNSNADPLYLMGVALDINSEITFSTPHNTSTVNTYLDIKLLTPDTGSGGKFIVLGASGHYYMYNNVTTSAIAGPTGSGTITASSSTQISLGSTIVPLSGNRLATIYPIGGDLVLRIYTGVTTSSIGTATGSDIIVASPSPPDYISFSLNTAQTKIGIIFKESSNMKFVEYESLSGGTGSLTNPSPTIINKGAIYNLFGVNSASGSSFDSITERVLINFGLIADGNKTGSMVIASPLSGDGSGGSGYTAIGNDSVQDGKFIGISNELAIAKLVPDTTTYGVLLRGAVLSNLGTFNINNVAAQPLVPGITYYCDKTDGDLTTTVGTNPKFGVALTTSSVLTDYGGSGISSNSGSVAGGGSTRAFKFFDNTFTANGVKQGDALKIVQSTTILTDVRLAKLEISPNQPSGGYNGATTTPITEMSGNIQITTVPTPRVDTYNALASFSSSKALMVTKQSGSNKVYLELATYNGTDIILSNVTDASNVFDTGTPVDYPQLGAITLSNTLAIVAGGGTEIKVCLVSLVNNTSLTLHTNSLLLANPLTGFDRSVALAKVDSTHALLTIQQGTNNLSICILQSNGTGSEITRGSTVLLTPNTDNIRTINITMVSSTRAVVTWVDLNTTITYYRIIDVNVNTLTVTVNGNTTVNEIGNTTQVLVPATTNLTTPTFTAKMRTNQLVWVYSDNDTTYSVRAGTVVSTGITASTSPSGINFATSHTKVTGGPSLTRLNDGLFMITFNSTTSSYFITGTVDSDNVIQLSSTTTGTEITGFIRYFNYPRGETLISDTGTIWSMGYTSVVTAGRAMLNAFTGITIGGTGGSGGSGFQNVGNLVVGVSGVTADSGPSTTELNSVLLQGNIVNVETVSGYSTISAANSNNGLVVGTQYYYHLTTGALQTTVTTAIAGIAISPTEILTEYGGGSSNRFDTIYEASPDHGVIIDGVLIKDGTINAAVTGGASIALGLWENPTVTDPVVTGDILKVVYNKTDPSIVYAAKLAVEPTQGTNGGTTDTPITQITGSIQITTVSTPHVNVYNGLASFSATKALMVTKQATSNKIYLELVTLDNTQVLTLDNLTDTSAVFDSVATIDSPQLSAVSLTNTLAMVAVGGTNTKVALVSLITNNTLSLHGSTVVTLASGYNRAISLSRIDDTHALITVQNSAETDLTVYMLQSNGTGSAITFSSSVSLLPASIDNIRSINSVIVDTTRAVTIWSSLNTNKVYYRVLTLNTGSLSVTVNGNTTGSEIGNTTQELVPTLAQFTTGSIVAKMGTNKIIWIYGTTGNNYFVRAGTVVSTGITASTSPAATQFGTSLTLVPQGPCITRLDDDKFMITFNSTTASYFITGTVDVNNVITLSSTTTGTSVTGNIRYSDYPYGGHLIADTGTIWSSGYTSAATIGRAHINAFVGTAINGSGGSGFNASSTAITNYVGFALGSGTASNTPTSTINVSTRGPVITYSSTHALLSLLNEAPLNPATQFIPGTLYYLDSGTKKFTKTPSSGDILAGQAVGQYKLASYGHTVYP